MASRTLTLGGTPYPLVLPNIRDPRLHVAAVIISVHVLGQVGLHFRVSVPQILAAILASAILEIVLTFRQSRAIVWPASAMLTGSGVALIMRVVGTPPDDPWNTSGVLIFAVVSALSLLSKYVIRYRGSHVFNPSNIGLVVAFVVLGMTRVEPLDFWWAPLNVPMIAAYAVIIVGGLLITRRLRLLGLAVSFWAALAAGTGILAASGHCMTANWAFAPVCGVDFWRTIVISPEVLIFLFFMITDPKTVPGGAVGRIAFGVLVGVVSVLLMAPQTNEFGTKVGLLAGLVILSAARPILDRMVPAPGSATDDIGAYARGLVGRGATGAGAGAGALRGTARAGVAILAVLVVGVGIVLAGVPARGPVAPDTAALLDGVEYEVDPATFPTITVDPGALDFDHTLAGSGSQAVLLTLAENLEVESQALLRRDAELLTAVDHGDRLDEMRARLDEAEATGRTSIERYRFDAVHVVLIFPFGAQTGVSLGFESRGTVTTETYDPDGTLLSSESSPFEQTFALRRATGDRWLNVAVRPTVAGD